jgi:hypothetical protein
VRGLWTVGVALIVAAALVAIAVGVTYLSVDARSLPSVLGKVAGASAKRTERGFFAVMLGGLLLLLAIVFNQFRPGGALDLGKGGTAGQAQPEDRAARE